MKRFLSVICMALLAGGMIFTSCTKQFTITVEANPAEAGTVTGGGTFNDQATTTLTATPNAGWEFVQWQDGVKQNPRTVSVTANETYIAYFKALPTDPTVKVTFNGENWNAGSIQGAYYASASAWNVYAEAAAQDYPKSDVAMFTGTSTGSHTDAVDPETAFLSTRGSEFGWVDYYYDSYLYDANNNVYGDWWAKNATVNVTAFDATAMTMNANVNATMFDAAEALIDGAGIDGATTASMAVNMMNIELSAAKNSINLNKKVNGKLSVAR